MSAERHIERLLRLTGRADAEEALGIVTAWKTSHDAVPRLQEQAHEIVEVANEKMRDVLRRTYRSAGMTRELWEVLDVVQAAADALQRQDNAAALQLLEGLLRGWCKPSVTRKRTRAQALYRELLDLLTRNGAPPAAASNT